MKKLLTATVCSIPLAFASAAYAQTTTAPSTDTPATTSDNAGTPAPTPGAPAAGGAAAPGATDPGTTAGAPAGAADTDTNDQKERITGWSVKDKIIGKSVHNENDEKVGDVTDVVLSSDGKAAYFVVGAGGFLGMGKHDVAIPFDEIQRSDDKLRLSGYTKDQLKALPEVKVAE